MNDQASFHFEVNPGRHLIKVTLSGFWDSETLLRFDHAARREVAQMTRTRRGQAVIILIDARASCVQSKEVAIGLQKLAVDVSAMVKKTAVLVASTLQQLQSQRINPADYHRVFSSETDAMNWLELESVK